MAVEPFEHFSPRIHPEAFIHPSAQVIGEVGVGAQSTVWPCAVLRGDHGPISVGERTSLQDGAVCHSTEDRSQTVVGDECTVGHRAILHGCRIGNRCLVGMGSILLDNVQLGDECFIGAGTLLTPGKIFPPRSFILGSPGKRVREVTAQELEWITYSWKAYVDLARRHRRP